jgi:hypothetical protein
MMMVSQGLPVDDHGEDNYSSFTIFRKKSQDGGSKNDLTGNLRLFKYL